MRKEYEDIVRNVCRLTNWKTASDEERQGAIGVACVLAHLRGVKPLVADLASHIGLTNAEVEEPFRRLVVNGIFSNTYDLRNDPVFLGNGKELKTDSFVFSAEEQTRNAWSTIAGLAGGLTGLRETALVS